MKEEKARIIVFKEDTQEIYVDVDLEQVARMLIYKENRRIRKAIRAFYGDKIMIFQEMLKKAVKELKNDELKVFNYFLSVMDFENWINIPQKEIAKDLGIHRVNVSKAIKGLREKGYIQVIKKSGENYYRINANIAWKGSEKSHLKVLRRDNPLID